MRRIRRTSGDTCCTPCPLSSSWKALSSRERDVQTDLRILLADNRQYVFDVDVAGKVLSMTAIPFTAVYLRPPVMDPETRARVTLASATPRVIV